MCRPLRSMDVPLKEEVRASSASYLDSFRAVRSMLAIFQFGQPLFEERGRRGLRVVVDAGSWSFSIYRSCIQLIQKLKQNSHGGKFESSSLLVSLQLSSASLLKKLYIDQLNFFSTHQISCGWRFAVTVIRVEYVFQGFDVLYRVPENFYFRQSLRRIGAGSSLQHLVGFVNLWKDT
ncbi:unnamed protein product [Nesidiocoris tenuis]|uniref:Uncharacterized protein n=1 Tax=Nesidiocoris tenuis TaxID=355587 RepID=A0A6H5H7V6_9HEMI|nr:unnamed protein product [Nesidiocoris tenuis]